MERRSLRRVPRRVARRAPHAPRSRSAARSATSRARRPTRWSATPPACPGAATPALTSPATAGSTSRPACSAEYVARTSSRSRKRCAVWPPSPRRCTASLDRGTVRAGSAADLVVWDPSRLGVGATRWADDFPAGGGRFVVESTGYRALVVNGCGAARRGRRHRRACRRGAPTDLVLTAPERFRMSTRGAHVAHRPLDAFWTYRYSLSHPDVIRRDPASPLPRTTPGPAGPLAEEVPCPPRC